MVDHVVLREIAEADRAAVEALRVAPAQEQFVASVAESLVEAAETPGACPWFRAAYVDDAPIGFVMLSDNIPPDRVEYLGPYFLWRLLIDAQYQGRGYGRAVLDLVVAYVRTRPGAERLLCSHIPGDGGPLGFYLKYGFTQTGETFDGEPVLELPLASEFDFELWTTHALPGHSRTTVRRGLNTECPPRAGSVQTSEARPNFERARQSFEHEREVRGVIAKFPRRPEPDAEAGYVIDWSLPSPPGIAVPIEPEILISDVRIAPDAPSWFADVVAEVTQRYGFAIAVSQSELDGDPIF